MKLFAAILMLLLCAPALAVSDEAGQVEATTAITLPVDSVTIYPDGLMAVKRTGNLDVTDGVHKFVINVPEKAEQSSVLLSVSNATQERVVYEANPVYTLNISAPGSQSFDLSYLMYDAAAWKPVYDLHLLGDYRTGEGQCRAQQSRRREPQERASQAGSGPASGGQSPIYAKAAPQINQRYAQAAPLAEAMDYAAAPAPSSGELETLYIFELEGRKDLVMDKEIGFPLFEEEAPLVRIYTWDASSQTEGPAKEEIRANNTLTNPWPTGKALLYRNDEYVSTIEMPYTPAGTNASIVVGPSADLKVERKLSDYNITENIREIGTGARNHTVKETTETWTYDLKIKSNLDRVAALEVTDTVPQEAVILSVTPKPAESTATSLKWKLQLAPRQKTAINYTYQVTTTESLDSAY